MNRPGMRGMTLAETSLYRLYALYEQPYLLDKTTRKIVPLRDHYGDPSCGIIHPDGEWCAVGGEGVSVYFPDSREEVVYLSGSFVQSLAMIGPDILEIRTDRPEDGSGIWQLNVGTREMIRTVDPPGASG